MNRTSIAAALAFGLLVNGLAGATAARADTIQVTYGAPGVQTVAANICAGTAQCVYGVETFDNNFNGTTGFAGSGGHIAGTYAGAYQISGANQFGGAGGGGSYPVTFTTGGYTITLSHDATIPGVNFFGFWLSALDSGNEVAFLSNGVQVGTYSPGDLLSAIGSNRAYYGNPDAAFAGQDANEPFAFVSFFDTTGFFDQIHIYESPQVGGYESDNHTVGYRNLNTPVGNDVPVPEPGAAGLLAAAIGGLLLLRRRRTA